MSQDTKGSLVSNELNQPSLQLKQALVGGLKPDSAYNVKITSENFGNGVKGIITNATDAYNAKVTKIGDNSYDPSEVLTTLHKDGKLVHAVDMGNLANGHFGILDQPSSGYESYLTTEQIPMLKSLGVIGSDAPNGGSFTHGAENKEFVDLLKQNDNCVVSEVTSPDGRKITEFRSQTKIPGVDTVISIPTRILEDYRSICNATGYQLISGFRLELTPDFYTKSLNIENIK